MELNPKWRNSVQIEGAAKSQKEIDRFIKSINTIIKERNFYRGKKIEYGVPLRFLDVRRKSWDSIILDSEIRAEIKSNTTGFLAKRGLWDKFGIPPKRGIILAGEPGTGKTLICKAVMAEAEGITCITTDAYGLGSEGYVSELYELAQDLSPSIVFIEDLDIIGQDRRQFGYSGPPLHSLLAALDGIEEKKEIVTVATTNCVDTLDKALNERPSRFDRVIKLSRPSLEQRKKLICLLSQKIPIGEDIQGYLASRAENCTPAQIQEIIFSLVIEHAEEMSREAGFSFTKANVDVVVSKISGKNRQRLGFCTLENHYGNKPFLMGIARTNNEGEKK